MYARARTIEGAGAVVVVAVLKEAAVPAEAMVNVDRKRGAGFSV